MLPYNCKTDSTKENKDIAIFYLFQIIFVSLWQKYPTNRQHDYAV